MKQFFLALMLVVLMIGSAAASTFGIIGGMIVSGTQIGTPIVVSFDGRELFFTLNDCETARKTLLRAPVTKGTSNNAGVFDQNALWAGVPVVSKTDVSACVPTTIQH
jgi:hypothetical protein